jgi:hypothetical protein
MTLEKQVDSYINLTLRSISEIDTDLLKKFSLEKYIRSIELREPYQNYNQLNQNVSRLFRNIELLYGNQASTLYHKLGLVTFIDKFVKDKNKLNLPYNVINLYERWFKRTLEDFSQQANSFYNHNNDLFLKDLGVCSQRLIPVGGSWVVEISGIGRRFLFTGGLRQFIDGTNFALLKMRGFKPFYQIHTDIRYTKYFNEENRRNCYLTIAELLKLNRKIKGMFAGSWLYDPQLEEVSPRLAYLRRKPLQNGAKTYRLGTNEADITLATAKSPTRRRLFREGKYIPTAYLIIWPRRELLQWSEKQSIIQEYDDSVKVRRR